MGLLSPAGVQQLTALGAPQCVPQDQPGRPWPPPHSVPFSCISVGGATAEDAQLGAYPCCDELRCHEGEGSDRAALVTDTTALS